MAVSAPDAMNIFCTDLRIPASVPICQGSGAHSACRANGHHPLQCIQYIMYSQIQAYQRRLATHPKEHPMTVQTTVEELRAKTRSLCALFPDEYWRETDRNRRYPQEFVDRLTKEGLLAALIPTEYGGLGVNLTQASVIMEEINKSGGHSAACHAQMYTMGALLRHGNDEQKNAYLPAIATGDLRLQAFSITEPAAGSDTTTIITTAERDGDHYVLTGHKNGTSRISESDLALVLARTSHKTENRTRGLTLFLVDLRQVRAEQPDTLEVVPVRTMFNYATN